MGIPIEMFLVMMVFQFLIMIIVFANMFYRFRNKCEEITLKNCNSLIIKYMIFASVILNLVFGGDFRDIVSVAVRFLVFIFIGWVTTVIGFKFFKISIKKDEFTHKKIWLLALILGFIANLMFSLSVYVITYALNFVM